MSEENECVKLKKKSLNKKLISNLSRNELNQETSVQIASVIDCSSVKLDLQKVKNQEDEQENDKQMLGGCCVCGDDTGYSNNLLVYCDGVDCKVAVHQCCYGILNLPDDSWYCGSCKYKIELADNALKNKCSDAGTHLSNEFKKLYCELCPCREGALKRTDNNKWAHVVCALYIPEISFGSVKTMEPVILKEIKSERFDKKCSVCQIKDNNCSNGVFVNCGFKNGCQEWFHVTCAQRMGFLCEESNVTSKNNLNYSIYCSVHLDKLLTEASNCVKKLPPFNINLCPVSNPLNENNLSKSLTNLIHYINQSIHVGTLVNDLSAFIEDNEKEKFSAKIKLNNRKNCPSENMNNQRKYLGRNTREPIIDLSEKKRKKFSFNNSSCINQKGTKKQNIVNKVKLEIINETNEFIKIKNDTQNELKIESKIGSYCEINENESKHAGRQSIPELVENEKTIDIQIELQENEKNDDCNSTKSFRSTSTNHSCKSKRKLNTNVDKNKFNKSKKPKLNTNQPTDKKINCNPALTINLDDSKLACNSGIITPSTSSCASSISSNFSKSPDSIGDLQSCKSKDYHQEAKPINDSLTQSIDPFGNFLIQQKDKSCESNSLKEEIDYHVDSLEQLLTKQWDLGADLCSSLSTKFDCMDLLVLLNKCKQENLEMEKKLKILEKTNSEYEQMNKKLSQPFNKNDDLTPIKKSNKSESQRSMPVISFNKVINDQVQNHVITNKSSFQPDTNSLNYSNLIQQSLSYLHSKSPRVTSPDNNNCLVNLYNKQMQNQSAAQSSNSTNFQASNAWNPATSCNTSLSQTPTSQNLNSNSSLNCLLSQNQLLQSFQQLNPMQQQQIASYYYMAATSNSLQTIKPTLNNSYNS